MSEVKLLSCPFCKREKTDEDIHGGSRDWKPTFYDPDSGGDPLNIVCECGLQFATGTYEYKEFVEAWNKRKPMDDIVKRLNDRIAIWDNAHKKHTDIGSFISADKMADRMAETIECRKIVEEGGAIETTKEIKAE